MRSIKSIEYTHLALAGSTLCRFHERNPALNTQSPTNVNEIDERVVLQRLLHLFSWVLFHLLKIANGTEVDWEVFFLHQLLEKAIRLKIFIAEVVLNLGTNLVSLGVWFHADEQAVGIARRKLIVA